MAVDDGPVVVVILLTDKAAGILAEGAHLVLEGAGIAHQLGFIQHPVDLLHDLVADFHTDADVHGAGPVQDIVLFAEGMEPVGAPAAGGDDRVGSGQLC